jgi:MFS family permease
VSAPLAAVRLVFALNGFVLASWVPHIPTVAGELGLSPGLLGRVLLGMALGAFVGIPAAGAAIGRFGSRIVVGAGAVIFCLGGLAPVRAADPWTLGLALVAFGAGNGGMDVSMNAQAAAIERQVARPVMSSMHGMWSLGGLAGAGAAAVALWAGVSPRHHMTVVCLVALVAILAALGRFLPAALDVRAAANTSPRATPRTQRVLTLGGMAFVALLIEGAMADWSALYLRDALGTSASVGALGFAAGSLTMAAGRFAGDALVQRFGNAASVQGLAGGAAAGFALALLLAHPIAAIVGFGCLGAGLANLIPIIFRTAATLPGLDAGRGLVAVSSAGYIGLLAGPPLLGLLSDYASLSRALWVLVAGMGWIAASARQVDQPPG